MALTMRQTVVLVNAPMASRPGPLFGANIMPHKKMYMALTEVRENQGHASPVGVHSRAVHILVAELGYVCLALFTF